MRSTLHPPAPSSTLLKFLKSQSEGICFFSPNPRPGFIFDHAAPRGPPLRSSIVKFPSKSSARCLSTTPQRRATVEAGFVNLDFLWPRDANKALQPKSPQCRSTIRIKKPSYENLLPAYRASSTGWHDWRQRVWGRKKKGHQPLQPDDLPDSFYPREDGGDSMFSLGRHISSKAAAQPKLRCTELDENGNVVLASGEFKKTELIAKVQHHGQILQCKC
jgi:magnesium transporter